MAARLFSLLMLNTFIQAGTASCLIGTLLHTVCGECVETSLKSNLPSLMSRLAVDDAERVAESFLDDIVSPCTEDSDAEDGEVTNMIAPLANDSISSAFSFRRPSGSINKRTRSVEDKLKKDYDIGKLLGVGGFCRVNLATHILTGETVALKIINTSKTTQGEGEADTIPRSREARRRASLLEGEAETIENLQSEQKALARMNHPHIVAIFDSFFTSDVMFISMEYVPGGDLFDYIAAQAHLEEPESCTLTAQLLSALGHVHERGFVHRDVKPENVLLDRNRCVKLIDFGLADPRPSRTGRLRGLERGGSPSYLAPEVILDDAELEIGPKVDLWGVGIVLFAMLTGALPFGGNRQGTGATSASANNAHNLTIKSNDTRESGAEGDNEQEDLHTLLQNIVASQYVVPDYVSEGAREMIAALLQPDPEQRLSVRAAINHSWAQKVAPAAAKQALHELDRAHRDECHTSTDEARLDAESDEEASGVIQAMEELGFNARIAKKHVRANELDHITATYKLLRAKARRVSTTVASSRASINSLTGEGESSRHSLVLKALSADAAAVTQAKEADELSDNGSCSSMTARGTDLRAAQDALADVQGACGMSGIRWRLEPAAGELAIVCTEEVSGVCFGLSIEESDNDTIGCTAADGAGSGACASRHSYELKIVHVSGNSIDFDSVVRRLMQQCSESLESHGVKISAAA
eukprot:g2052.t1